MTTAILRPTGLTAIDLIPTGDPKTEDYILQNAPDLKEHERMEIAYSEGANLDGGEAISYHGPLVVLALDVVVHGSGVSEDAARQQLLQRVEALQAAVCNSLGGTFEYKPDELGAGVRSTFYHYIQSPPPKLRATTNNDWGAAPVETEPDYVCAIELEIELQTQPYATSDPSSPVAVKTATTVYNQDDSVVGYATIAAADVKGTVEALTQLRIRNLVAGTWAAIGKMWYARRTKGTLANFNPIFEGGTADADSTIHWSTEADTTRRTDNFLRYAPPEAANDQWAHRYFTISNIADHEGKAAIAVVVRSLGETKAAWDLKAALQVADVIVETDVKNVASVGNWTVCILGELDIPPTPISDDESYATKLYVYFRRTTGDEVQAIDLDFGMLLYVDEYVQQVNIPDGYTNAYRLLMENFERELCHVVAQDTLALEKVAEPLCPFLKLRPGKDNRIDFIWERLGRTYEILADDLEDYEAWWWLPIADMEDDEAWEYGLGGAPSYWEKSTSYVVEAEKDVHIHAESTTGAQVLFDVVLPDVNLDLLHEGRFGDNDYIYVTIYVSASGATSPHPGVMIALYTGDNPHFKKEWTDLPNGWNFLKAKKSDFEEALEPDWANITSLRLRGIVGGDAGCFADFYFDDWRIVRADPDDATKGNDTGTIWDFMRDVWHIEEQDSSDKALGCIDNTAALEQVALIHEEPQPNIKYLAQVRAKRDDGDVGLVFRCEDGTSGSEDMAAFFIDTANDELELRKWAAGAASDIATAVAQVTAPDVDYWLGVWMIENRVRCYFGTSKAAIWNDEEKEFVTSARVFNVTDTVFASGGALNTGQAGLLSIGTLGRFDKVELYGVGDGHVPGDTIQVEAKAIYRTIYPFRE